MPTKKETKILKGIVADLQPTYEEQKNHQVNKMGSDLIKDLQSSTEMSDEDKAAAIKKISPDGMYTKRVTVLLKVNHLRRISAKFDEIDPKTKKAKGMAGVQQYVDWVNTNNSMIIEKYGEKTKFVTAKNG
jgi:hypothetical protein